MKEIKAYIRVHILARNLAAAVPRKNFATAPRRHEQACRSRRACLCVRGK
jgi:hypothetical protein